ncbi:MAG: regulatory protein [Acidobacteriaceae bacterium]|nr:regulatory protein [Acidobacteriaceae bacterium]
MTSPVRTLIVKPIGGSSAFEAAMPFSPRKKPEPLDETALYQYAVGALARQMRTVAELKRLMSRRVEPGESGEAKVAAVVARLLDQRYLDDPAFASTYTRLRQENQSFGKRRVQQELTRKGVQGELVASTIESAYAQVSEEDLGRRYIARKRIAKPEDEKQTARLIRRLVGAGFSFAIISKLLKTWEIDCSEADLVLPDDAAE